MCPEINWCPKKVLIDNPHMLFNDRMIKEMIFFSIDMPHWEVDRHFTIIYGKHLRGCFHIRSDVILLPELDFHVHHLIKVFRAIENGLKFMFCITGPSVCSA